MRADSKYNQSEFSKGGGGRDNESDTDMIRVDGGGSILSSGTNTQMQRVGGNGSTYSSKFSETSMVRVGDGEFTE